MSDLLDGRVAVVTGGASGIGRATVRRFLAEGARVVFGDVHEDNAARFVDEIADPDRLRFVPTDVTDETAVAALVAAAVDGFGRLDIMFNNAGVGGAFGPLVEIDAADWDRTFAVISRGMFLGTKHAARAMIARGDGGAIVNNASVAGLGGGGGPTAYSAAKAAVINFTANAAVELAAHRIRVNAVCPGLIETGMTRPIFDGARKRGTEGKIGQLNPLRRAGRPEEIAAMALFLASDDASYVNGQAYAVDGGLSSTHPFAGGALKLS